MQVRPGRKIPKNHNVITGRLYSEKSKNRSIAFESKLERDFYMIFEFLSEVVEIEEQPFTLESDDGLRYTPDFRLVLEKEGVKRQIIGEVKYRKDLKKNWGKLRGKFQMASDYCMGLEDTEFKIFTDACSLIANRDYMYNIHFLLSFRELDYTAQKILKKNFRKGITVGKLLAKCSDDEYERMRIASSLWYLVRRHAIDADLSRKLSYETVLESFKFYKGYHKTPIMVRHIVRG